MLTRSFRKENNPSSYLSILLRINESDVEELGTEEDRDFLERFENRHYLLMIFKYLNLAGWLYGKEHERRIILMMGKHTKFQVLATAVKRLTFELDIIRGVNKTQLELIQQECLTALLLSNNPIKLASSVIELKYRRGFNSVTQLQDHLKLIQTTIAADIPKDSENNQQPSSAFTI